MHVPLKRGFTKYILRLIVTFRRRSVLTKKLFLAVITLWFSVCNISLAQTLTTLKHQPPDGAGVPFLLTDGTVLVQGNQRQDWWMLTPDINGSYVNGTWTQVASLAANYDRALPPGILRSIIQAPARTIPVPGFPDRISRMATTRATILPCC
jgi:hypothetical protein